MRGKEAALLILTPLKVFAVATALYGTPAHAQESRATESHVGDLMRARDPLLGSDGLFGMTNRWSERYEYEDQFDIEEQAEAGLGRFVQRDILRRRFGLRTEGEMSFDDENILGENGIMFQWRFRRPIEPSRRRDAFDPDN